MTDARHHISTVRRTLGTRTLEAGEARVQTISQVYDTDPDDMWDVVTNPARIERWFLPVEGELKLGGHYQLKGNAGGTVTACDPPRGYAATWEFGDMVSWIEVRLTPEGEGRTRFELEHVAHVDDSMWDQFGAGGTGLGWDSGFWGLAKHLSDPAAAPDNADVMAWLASEEGRAVLRGSADGWAAAEIAAGADPAAAKRHADTSYAAYTGG
jgi:uncharacterized protein YndB with AHSA1/START domain